jgi:hypothetical protein
VAQECRRPGGEGHPVGGGWWRERGGGRREGGGQSGLAHKGKWKVAEDKTGRQEAVRGRREARRKRSSRRGPLLGFRSWFANHHQDDA